MNILILSRGCPSERYPLHGIFEFDQARALRAMGHDVALAALDLRSIRRRRKLGFSRTHKEGIPVYQVSIPVGAVPPFVLQAIGRLGFMVLYRLILSGWRKPDIIHGHFYAISAMAAVYCKKQGIPFVMTEHASDVNGALASKKAGQYARRAYTHATRVIAVSPALAQSVGRVAGFEKPPTVIPNIVDASFPMNRQKKDANIPFTFVSSGSLLPKKGHDITIKAFAQVRKAHPRCQLIIMGDGPERLRLEKLARDLSLGEHILFWGQYRRAESYGVYMKSDGFVLASRGETFGVVYIEAMACGLPVIATRCGGPESFVREADGVLVAVDSVAEVARAMGDMMAHPGRYDAKAIRDGVIRRFSPEEIARQITAVYGDILQKEKDGI